MKGTKNQSKKRTRPARSAKENQRHIIYFTISSAEGIYACVGSFSVYLNGVVESNIFTCSLDAIFLYNFWNVLYYSGGILFIKNWIYVRLLKKCLNVFVIEGVEEEVCIIKSNDWKKILFCMKVYQL